MENWQILANRTSALLSRMWLKPIIRNLSLTIRIKLNYLVVSLLCAPTLGFQVFLSYRCRGKVVISQGGVGDGVTAEMVKRYIEEHSKKAQNSRRLELFSMGIA